MDGDMHKRDWNQKLQMWGKRGWNNLHGGWGLKRSVPSTWSEMPSVEKRGWDSLQVNIVFSSENNICLTQLKFR